MQRVKTSFIVIHYSNIKNLLNCLGSIYKTKPKINFEVIVVNNSRKNIKKKLKRFPEVVYLKSPKNLGYGGGNNFGARVAKGEYLFILNPDTEVLKGSVDTLVKFLDSHPNAAIVAPILVNKDGKVYSQLGSRKLTPLRGIFALSFLNKIFPNNPISRQYFLMDKSENNLRRVDAVPGSAFLIRKDIFEKAGGYDENMFLYFEESDLGQRIGKLGKKIYINPKAQVMHHWGKQTGDRHLQKHFNHSRFYYFRKHYGLFWALLVEAFARFSKTTAILIFLILIGGFLRFYRIPQNLVFHGELGHNYLAILNAWQTRNIPLLGPPTSHPWLYFGPAFYWLFGPILILANFNPLSGAYFMAFVSVLLILVNYVFIEKIFNKKIATISSFLITFSLMYISLAREARFFSLVIFFFYPFFYYLAHFNPILLGFWWGVLLNFHLTVIIYAPAILYVLIKKKITLKKLFAFSLGLFIPNIPFLLADLKNNLTMTSKLFLWFPYRVLGFFGFIDKNNATSQILVGNATSLLSFLSSWFYQNNLIGLITLIILTYVIVRSLRRSNLDFRSRRFARDDEVIGLLSLMFIFGILAIFIHGDPPRHYFLPLYTPLILFLSITFSSLPKKLTILVLLAFGLISFGNLVISDWYFQNKQKIKTDLVPYALQVQAVDAIARFGKNDICLGRRGPYNQFEGDFAQNYWFLLATRGISAHKCAKDEIVICERKTCSGELIFSQGGLEVYEVAN